MHPSRRVRATQVLSQARQAQLRLTQIPELLALEPDVLGLRGASAARRIVRAHSTHPALARRPPRHPQTIRAHADRQLKPHHERVQSKRHARANPRLQKRPALGRDCIFLKDWVIDCNIGVYAEEKVAQKVG